MLIDVPRIKKRLVIWGVHHLGCRGVSVRFSSVGVGFGMWSFFCTPIIYVHPKKFHF